jgi:hypothetical protein
LTRFTIELFLGMGNSDEDAVYIQPTSPSTDSFVTTMDVNGTTPPIEGAVGLSNHRLSHGRRKMLDLVNRLHSTG